MILNGEIVSKTRSSIEPQINPTAKIIGNLTTISGVGVVKVYLLMMQLHSITKRKDIRSQVIIKLMLLYHLVQSVLVQLLLLQFQVLVQSLV